MKHSAHGLSVYPRRGEAPGQPTTLNIRPGGVAPHNSIKERKLEARLRREVARSIEETFGKD